MATAYEGYQPLNESQRQIRLLTIHFPSSCSDNESIVNCTLDTIALRDANPFYALSYVWGPATPSNPISVNGQIIHVRMNLWLFLHALSTRFSPKSESKSAVYSPINVWADFVCIQQSNIRERNHQVSMMGDIYRNADAIYAWLGESATPLNDEMQCIAETVLMRQQNVPWFQIRKQLGDVEARIRGIAASPYWTRMWIKQEALLAKNLWFFYGAETANWQDVSFVVKLCPNARVNGRVHGSGRDSRSTTHGAMLALLQIRDTQLVESELSVLMQRFADAQCQDARDRIYALLALIDKDTRQQIIVDYSKPVFQVLLENYVHWTQHDPTRISMGTISSDAPMYQLGHFCSSFNKVLPEADFELLCGSADARREVTAQGVFTAINVSSIDWKCAIATIGATTLKPISRTHEINSEGRAFVLRISLRPHRSRIGSKSSQRFIYSNVLPNSSTLAAWIGPRMLFLQPPEDSLGIRSPAIHNMRVIGTGAEIRVRYLNNGEDDRLSAQLLQHPSHWLSQQFHDARFEFERTSRRMSIDTVPIICNAAAMVSLIRESRRDHAFLTRSDSGGHLSYEEIRNGSTADGQPMLWSPYLFGLEHKLLQPCRACRSSATLPRWRENVHSESPCDCRWNNCTEC